MVDDLRAEIDGEEQKNGRTKWKGRGKNRRIEAIGGKAAGGKEEGEKGSKDGRFGDERKFGREASGFSSQILSISPLLRT